MQHIISRFIDRKWQLANAIDRKAYLGIVDDIASETDWTFCAFVLMSSHTHWAVLPGFSPLSQFYHRLHTRYGIYWRKEHGSVGPIFAGRPKNYEIDPQHLLRLIAYIHMNPVRAGVVNAPHESDWSSHVFYMRQKKAPKWLAVAKTLSLLGFDDTRSGRQHFDEAVRSTHFQDGKLKKPSNTTDAEYSLSLSMPSRPGICTLDMVAAVVERKLDVSSLLFRSRSKRPAVIAAKRLLIKLAKIQGYSYGQIGEFIGISRVSVRDLDKKRSTIIKG